MALLGLMARSSRLPENSVPFIYDGHLYLQSALNDSIPISIVYDTGADFLYLDEDFIDIAGLRGSFGRIGKARMGGAGNKGPQQIDIFIDSIMVDFGKASYRTSPTPVIRLRDILGRHTDGLLGNTHILTRPLEVCFSQGYLRQLDSLPPGMTDGYRRLKAHFNDNRIDIEASLRIDSVNSVSGLFRMDLGCGSAVVLTKSTAELLDLEASPKAYFSTQAGGVGGGSDLFITRAESFAMLDTLENIVIDCSLNEAGSLSKNSYVGLIGNEIWKLYDIIIDRHGNAVWVKRFGDDDGYSHSATVQMAFFDRTDISDGWIVNGLYDGGNAKTAGIEIGDIILSINGRPVKEIGWEEQRKGLGLEGSVDFLVRKADGREITYTLIIDKEII